MLYRSIETTKEAVQFDGGNFAEIMDFCPSAKVEDHAVWCTTAHGDTKVNPGDYIIRETHGPQGELFDFYPCDPTIFAVRYQRADTRGQIRTNDLKDFSPLLPGEPTFTLRGKDARALEVLRAIRHMGVYNNVGLGMNPVIDAFTRWQDANPDEVKVPS